MVNPGSPLETWTWTSTETGLPAAPVSVAAAMAASTARNGCVQLEGMTASFYFSGESGVVEPPIQAQIADSALAQSVLVSSVGATVCAPRPPAPISRWTLSEGLDDAAIEALVRSVLLDRTERGVA